MFSNQDEYIRATEKAGIYTYGIEEEVEKSKFSNLFIFTTFILVGYLGFNYLKNTKDIFPNIELPRLTIVDAKYTESDRELVAILDQVAVDTLNRIDIKKSERVDLSAAINSIVNENVSVEESSYIQSISKELELEKRDSVAVENPETLAQLEDDNLYRFNLVK